MEDKQLERLYDYTKFHVGIYLSAAGGLAALITTLASGKLEQNFLSKIVGHPWALAVAFILMVGAGAAGGIVATSTIESKTYEEFRATPQGAYGLNYFRGKTWVKIEHLCFWLSLLFVSIGVFSAEDVRRWMLK